VKASVCPLVRYDKVILNHKRIELRATYGVIWKERGCNSVEVPSNYNPIICGLLAQKVF